MNIGNKMFSRIMTYLPGLKLKLSTQIQPCTNIVFHNFNYEDTRYKRGDIGINK